MLPIMANQTPDSPPVHTVLLHDSEGLSSPKSELDGPPSSHIHPSDAAQILADDPASRQDHDFPSPQNDLPTTINDFDDLIASFLLANPELTYSPGSHTDNNVEQSWPNDPEAGLGGSSLPITQPKRPKRSISFSPPPGSSSKRQRIMATEVQKPLQKPPQKTTEKPKRSFQCVFRGVQAKLGLSYTCTAAPVNTVSAVRTHCIRKLPNGKPPHLPFLKLCITCNEDFLDEHEFETFHGIDGLKCENPKPQRKGDAGQREQYDILFSKVETYLTAQGATKGVPSMSATRALEQNSTCMEEAGSTDQSTDESIKGVKDAPQLYQLPRLDPIWCLASREQAVNTTGRSESTTSFPSSNGKVGAGYRICNDLAQDANRQNPMAIDFMNREDTMKVNPDDNNAVHDNVISSKESSPMRYLMHMEPPSSYSIQAHEHSVRQLGYSPTSIEYNSAVPTPSSDYDTSPCTSSTMTSISESDSLYTRLGNYTYSPGDSWRHDPDERFLSVPKSGDFGSAPHYFALQSYDSQGLTSGPSHELPNNLDAPIEKCDQCDKTFTGRYGKGNLTRHIRAFHSPLAVAVEQTCRICKRAYNRADARRKHEWKNHRIPDAMPRKRRK